MCSTVGIAHLNHSIGIASVEDDVSGREGLQSLTDCFISHLNTGSGKTVMMCDTDGILGKSE